MVKPITFEYSYKFKSGLNKKFVMNLERDTLNLILDRRPAPPLVADDTLKAIKPYFSAYL